MNLKGRIEKIEAHAQARAARKEIDRLLSFCTDEELEEMVRLSHKLESLEKATGISKMELVSEDDEGREIDSQMGQIWDRASGRMRAADESTHQDQEA